MKVKSLKGATTELPSYTGESLHQARLMILEEFEGHFQRTIDSGLWRPG